MPPEPRAERAEHRRLVDDTKEALADGAVAGQSLSDIARAVGTSPAHLSRVFRRVTGTTVHRYRSQLRLRAAADRLVGSDLSQLAAELGFSSHSHLSASFRRTFATTPSQARVELAG